MYIVKYTPQPSTVILDRELDPEKVKIKNTHSK